LGMPATRKPNEVAKYQLARSVHHDASL